MKPLTELVKEWEYDQRNLSGDAALVNESCTDELQAWLGEAEEFLADQRVDFSMSAFTVDMLRANLLGTTQKPKQEGSPANEKGPALREKRNGVDR